jgi:hypothetical protein
MSFDRRDSKRRQCISQAQQELKTMLAELCLKVHIAVSYPSKDKRTHQAVAVFEVIESEIYKILDQIDTVVIQSVPDLKAAFANLLDAMYSDRLLIKAGSPQYSTLKTSKQRFLTKFLCVCQQLAIYRFYLYAFDADGVHIIERLRWLIQQTQALARPREITNPDQAIAQMLQQQQDELSEYAAQLNQYLYTCQTESRKILTIFEVELEQICLHKQNKSVAALALKKSIQRHARRVQAYDNAAKQQRIQSILLVLKRLERFLVTRSRRGEAVAEEEGAMIRRYLNYYLHELDVFVEQGRELVQAAAQCQKDKNDYDEQLQRQVECFKNKLAEKQTVAFLQDAELMTCQLKTLDSKNVAIQRFLIDWQSQLDRAESMRLDLQEFANELTALQIPKLSQNVVNFQYSQITDLANDLTTAADHLQIACYDQVLRGEHTDWRGNIKPDYQSWYAVEETLVKLKSCGDNLSKIYHLLSQEVVGEIAETINLTAFLQSLATTVETTMKKAEESIAQYKQQLEANIKYVLDVFSIKSSELSASAHQLVDTIQLQKRELINQFRQQLFQLESRLNQPETATPFALVAIPSAVITKQDAGTVQHKIHALISRLDSTSQLDPPLTQKPLQRRSILLLASAIAGGSIGLAAGSAFGFLSGGIFLPIAITVGTIVGFVSGLALGIFSQFISFMKAQAQTLTIQDVFSTELSVQNDQIASGHLRRRSSVAEMLGKLTNAPKQTVSEDQTELATEKSVEKRMRHTRPRCFSLNEYPTKNTIELVAEFEQTVAKKTLDVLVAQAKNQQAYASLLREIEERIYPDAAKRVLLALQPNHAAIIKSCAQHIFQQPAFAGLALKALHQDYAYLTQYLTNIAPSLHP